MEAEKIIAYKGMSRDMKCHDGFQYEVGKEYETDHADVCKAGFHACEYPLDVFRYFPPANSRFFVVEQSGELSHGDVDTKIASSKIKIEAEIGISGLVKAAIEYTKSKSVPEKSKRTTGDRGAASATGDWGAASVEKLGVALAAGRFCKAKGKKGCGICVVERGDWDGAAYPIIAIKADIIDGVKLKEDTYYTLKNGEFVEAEK